MSKSKSKGTWPTTPSRKAPTKRVRKAFDRDALKRVCELREVDFPDAYGLTRVDVREPWSASAWRDADDDDGTWYAFRDNGASILAVAHLDTVVGHTSRLCAFAETASGTVCHSGALDDRLGAYTILHLLPALGINADVLLTTGEESGMSTAQYFDTEKDYDWVIEFDRGGMDVVAYQYDDYDLINRVENSGARMGQGSFSDIAYLEHLEVKCLNWGTGYTGPGHNYHSARAHVWLDDYFVMVARFLNFYADNAGVYLPHDSLATTGRGRGLGWRGWDDDWSDPDDDALWARTDDDDRYADIVDAVITDPTREDLDALADAYVRARESGDPDLIAHAEARLDAAADAADTDAA